MILSGASGHSPHVKDLLAYLWIAREYSASMRLWPSRDATTRTPTRAWRGGVFCMRAPHVVLLPLTLSFRPRHPWQIALLLFVLYQRVLHSSVPPIPVSGVLLCVLFAP